MASQAISNYKSCPLKKRPIVYLEEEQSQAAMLGQDQPQDLSLKRKSSADIEDYVQPAKREFVLNLTKSSVKRHNVDEQQIYRPASYRTLPSEAYYSSAMLSPNEDSLSSMEYTPVNIHLRGLTAATSGYTTTQAYQTAFTTAAGCNPINGLWSTYQPSFFPTPDSSIASLSAHSMGTMTPPSSPSSDECSEPEDLSVRADIPLPALMHLYGYQDSTMQTTNCTRNSHNNTTSSSSAKNYRFKCVKCEKMYSTQMGLSKHQEFHCPAAKCNQEKKQHACKDCGKLYTTMGALKMHVRTHTLPCKCPMCGKAFSRPWLLQGHIRTHTGEKPFQCPDCPRSFADRSNLRAHQQTHVEVKKYACKVCKKSFSRMSLLNKHANSNCTITIA